ncbi:MAG: hypothetical protein ACTSYC_03120 [Promethearchaeota archaeon]
MEIFLTGQVPVFSIFAWHIFEMIFLEPNSQAKKILGSKKVNILKIIYILAITTMCLGNAVHLIVNDLNNRAFNPALIASDSSYKELYFSIYFWDELFGHIALSVPLLALLGIILIGLSKEIPSRPLNWVEWILITLVGVGYGTVWFYGFTEGQVTRVASIINLFLLLYILFNELKNPNFLKDHPFVWIVLIETIIFLSFAIIWCFIFGLKPYYPYFYQPEEETWNF